MIKNKFCLYLINFIAIGWCYDKMIFSKEISATVFFQLDHEIIIGLGLNDVKKITSLFKLKIILNQEKISTDTSKLIEFWIKEISVL